jgi:hypothetical protein
MKKAELQNIPEYYQHYVGLVENLTIKAALDKHLTQFQNLDFDVLKELGDRTYAPGKWTTKEIIQHVIDWERIFSYRALVYARRDVNIPVSHDENVMTPNSKANLKSWEELKDDFLFARSSTISLFQSFDPEDLSRKAYSLNNEISVLMIGFIMVGHQIHHFNIIQERYLPLLGREVELVRGMRC